MWAFADTHGLFGVDFANYAAVFLPLLLTTHGKANLAKFPGISSRAFITAFDKNGRKKTGNLFLISCLGVPFYVAAVIQFLAGYNSTNRNFTFFFSLS